MFPAYDINYRQAGGDPAALMKLSVEHVRLGFVRLCERCVTILLLTWLNSCVASANVLAWLLPRKSRPLPSVAR